MTRPSSPSSADHDLLIDRALDALRATESPSLLSQRVLANLHQRTPVLPRRNIRLRTFVTALRPVPLFAAVAVLIATSLSFTLYRHHGQSRGTNLDPSGGSRVLQTSEWSARQNGASTPEGGASVAADPRNGRSRSVLAPESTYRGKEALSLERIPPQIATETDPAFLPSFPAPPMPLTAEERYLRTLARHGSQEETAQLNPTVRSAALTADTAEYLAFFAPPPLRPEIQLQLSHIQSQGASQ